MRVVPSHISVGRPSVRLSARPSWRRTPRSHHARKRARGTSTHAVCASASLWLMCAAAYVSWRFETASSALHGT